MKEKLVTWTQTGQPSRGTSGVIILDLFSIIPGSSPVSSPME